MSISKRLHGELSASARWPRGAPLKLISASGASLFLHATPSKAAPLNNDPSLFVGMLCRWLRVPFAEQDVERPCCRGVRERSGDHALVCSCGGDRTRRHNLLRNIVFHAANSVSVPPEFKNEGPLPQRPFDGGVCDNGSTRGERESEFQLRRQVDVFIPRWQSGPPATCGFAATSGLRMDLLVDATRGADQVCARYRDSIRSHPGTHSQCLAQAITFITMVTEAVGGGWGKLARGVWTKLAKSFA